MTDQSIYWNEVKNREQKYIIMATNEGICWVGKQVDFEKGKKWVTKVTGVKTFTKDETNKNLNTAIKILDDYLIGKKVTFHGPFDLYGTEFQKKVWYEMAKITYANTRTYGEIAQRIGRPKAVRAVGAACGANPVMILIPCHRVIGAKGNLTGYAGGLDLKKRFLSLEHSINT